MQITDPIADLLTRIRNASTAKHPSVDIPASNQENGTPVIAGLKRVSKPGLRIYTNCEDMPKVMKGLGTAIISTSKGVMTDKAARAAHVGGEVLAFVW